MRVPMLRVRMVFGLAVLAALATLQPLPLAAQVARQPEAAAAAPQASEAGAVAAVVNDIVISNYDVDQRLQLLAITRGLNLTPESRRQYRPQVLNQLIDEIIQLQEAKEREIDIAEEDVEKAMQRIAQSRNTDLAGLNALLKEQGVDILTLRTQVRAEIGWQRLIGRRLSSRVDISADEVDETMARIEQAAQRPQFEVLEIVLYFETDTQRAEATQFAQRLSNEIRLGAPFRGVAQQFSQAPTAAQGGSIGWVQEGELAAPLDAALKRLRPGQVSEPIVTDNAVLLLGLVDRREPAGTGSTEAAPTPPANPASVSIAQITIRARGDAQMREAMQRLVRIRDQADGCAQAADIARDSGFEYQSLGSVRFSDMAEPVRAGLQNAGPGGMMPPVQASDGSIITFIRCDQRIIRYQAFEMPTREEIEDRLFMGKLEAQARRYLRDLRRDANIEYR